MENRYSFNTFKVQRRKVTMKLGTLKSSSRDGKLVVVSKDNKKISWADHIISNLREAVEKLVKGQNRFGKSL